MERTQLIELAAALQDGSEHPLARAVMAWAKSEGVQPVSAEGMRGLPGRGVAADVNGRNLILGSTRLMADEGIALEQLAVEAARLESEGRTVSWVAERAPERRLLGLLAFGDEVKASAAAAVAALHGRGIRSVMLTGDNAGSARAAAAKLGIADVVANVLPEGKSDAVAALRGEDRTVAMVGDGVNDAPALAAADVGIAMSTGTDVAMHAAGITLMRGDPRLVADAIDISKRTYAKIRQGLFWAFIYNLVGIPLAALGYLSPVIAGAAMALSSVSVVANALTLRRWRLIPKAARRDSGYRDYGDREVHMLRFIRRARDLGFPIPEIAQLVALWQDGDRSSGEVKALALARAREMERKERELRTMRKSLEDLARRCAGGNRPDCPILDDLAIGTA